MHRESSLLCKRQRVVCCGWGLGIRGVFGRLPPIMQMRRKVRRKYRMRRYTGRSGCRVPGLRQHMSAFFGFLAFTGARRRLFSAIAEVGLVRTVMQQQSQMLVIR